MQITPNNDEKTKDLLLHIYIRITALLSSKANSS